ncbi:tRNA(Glu)-specific nuclease WapA precursor [Roseimaritima multifibrata]|uniref:tRNA(Glu)-specific nuclease WapA n=1 Tax=Roseimaritima multifibrata TaxID=1930274 RepID=A0A517MH97_9BACT|nr:RHS repeat-associated core domain-containing protein [Roseimaritima multifibrata]QDS94253.1 tRNA(Glu)-specific nuclease WapA precursor [Roseimaritima multifibrata]
MRAGTLATERLYYHRNQQYSVTALTDTTGTISERYAYDAYGKPTVLTGSGTVLSGSAYGNRYTYTGREWDGDLGLYHYRARMYDPVAGWFVSRDPVGYTDSASLYCASMLLMLVDPAGNAGIWEPRDPRHGGPHPRVLLPRDPPPPPEPLTLDQSAAYAACADTSYSRCGGCTQESCEAAVAAFIQAVDDSWLIGVPFIGPVGPHTCERLANDIIRRIPELENNPCVAYASVTIVRDSRSTHPTRPPTHAWATLKLCNGATINGDNHANGGEDQIWVGSPSNNSD